MIYEFIEEIALIPRSQHKFTNVYLLIYLISFLDKDFSLVE